MGAQYNPDEIERLIALCRTANPSKWRLDVADQLEAARAKVDDLAGWCRYALDNWAPGGSGKAEAMEQSLIGTIGERPK